MTVKPVAARSDKVRLPLVIYVLAVGTFVMGTTECGVSSP
jgi:predicted MFS family arabinose efflux permease